MLGGVDTDALPMLRHSRQGVNYHDLAIREALEALREREEVPLFGGPWYCGRADARGGARQHGAHAGRYGRQPRGDGRGVPAARTRPPLHRTAPPARAGLPQRLAARYRHADRACARQRRIRGFHTLTARSISMPSTFPTLFRVDVIRSTSTPPRRPDSGASSSKRRPSFPTAA